MICNIFPPGFLFSSSIKAPNPILIMMAPTSWGPLAFAERLGGILGIFAMDS